MVVWKDQRQMCALKFLRLEDFLYDHHREQTINLEPQGVLFADVSDQSKCKRELGSVQWYSLCTAVSISVQLPARSSASVPRGIVPDSRRCRITATSSLRCPAAPGRTASPAQLLWPTGFLCGWSVGLEFLARQLA